MKKRLNSKIINLVIILLLTVLLVSSFSIHADMGPKPFIDITINDLPQANYIVGVLSKEKTYGPYQAFTNDKSEMYEDDEYQILSLIYSKLNNENYYLFDVIKKYDDATSIVYKFGYYPPKDFKLFIFDENNDKIFISNPCSTYAFSSYFKGNIEDNEIVLTPNYQYGKEIGVFFVRLVLTLIIEIALAFAFKFNKKSLIIILIVNCATQLILNIVLNVFTYNNGPNFWAGIPLLLLIETLVFAVEIVLFRLLCVRKNNSKKLIILYTLLANTITLALSFVLWFMI